MTNSSEITWDQETEEKFKQMLEKVPSVLRGTAQKTVSQKAEAIVREENRSVIGEKDLVDAFFEATPFGFHGPMKTDMEALDIDYVKYGHPQ